MACHVLVRHMRDVIRGSNEHISLGLVAFVAALDGTVSDWSYLQD
jgi:hypothetical protein